MEIINFVLAEKGSKVGHFQVCITAWKELIIDMTLFQKGSHRWVTFPTIKYNKDGKDMYRAQMRFKEQTTHKAFENKVLQLLDEFREKQKQQPKQEESYKQFDLF